jgi:hypothetical protein
MQKTPRELRRFGLTVGGVFLVLAGISRWRGHVYAPAVMATLGVLLVTPGLLMPSVLGPVERRWMQFAEMMGRFNARVILSLLWILVMTPVGIVRRLLRDPLSRRMRDGSTSTWIRRTAEPVAIDRYRQQF